MDIATAISSTRSAIPKDLPHAGGEHELKDDEEERHHAPKVQSTRTLPHAGGKREHEDDDEETVTKSHVKMPKSTKTKAQRLQMQRLAHPRV